MPDPTLEKRYVTKPTAAFYTLEDPTGAGMEPPSSDTRSKLFKRCELLWGDPVVVLKESDGCIFKKKGGTEPGVWAIARGNYGWIQAKELRKNPLGLLELYFIDVGQGDSILIHTPADRWLLIDAGDVHQERSLNKSALSFLRWKFQDELKQGEAAPIDLDAVVITHFDDDHLGGLKNLLLGQKSRNESSIPVTFQAERLYHNGLTKDLSYQGAHIPVQDLPDEGKLRAWLEKALGGTPKEKKTIREKLDVISPYRLSVPEGMAPAVLPGFTPGEGCSIDVLGPVETTLPGCPALPIEDNDEGLTVNANSVILRLEYGKARILLTGDLNGPAEHRLLERYRATPGALKADVLKIPHHGSADFFEPFVKEVDAHAFVFMSGDNESFAHPRPQALGVAGRDGRPIPNNASGKETDDCMPLVYCTELFRSVSLRNGKLKVVYGLVNLRTDGKTILMATLNEKQDSFDVVRFPAGGWKA